jgi:NTP pyrophosphatase (non-canonical NTP hydrolase)
VHLWSVRARSEVHSLGAYTRGDVLAAMRRPARRSGTVGGGWQGQRVEIAELSDRVDKVSLRYAEYLGIVRDGDWLLLKLQEEVGELTQSYLQVTGRARDKGSTAVEIRQDFQQEFADVFCQLLLLARHFDVDIQQEIELKWLSREID